MQPTSIQPIHQCELRPVCGSLFKRKGSRYLPATSDISAPFWFEFHTPGPKSGISRLALRTRDPAEAMARANQLVWKARQFADEQFLRDRITQDARTIGKAHSFAYEPQRLATVQSDSMGHLPLKGLWEAVKPRYDARAKSLELYRTQTAKFVKYALMQGLAFIDEVTRDFAEGYARWIFPRVTTAQKHIGTLRREWSLLFPDSPTNPWNLGIRLQPKEKDHAMNYRCLTINEVRRVRQTVARLACAQSLPAGSRFRVLSPAILVDMCDAIVFSYRYGLRIGSIGKIRGKDFDRESGTWTHRPPKTSRATLGMDYPILPEIADILARRDISGGAQLFPAFARVHSSDEQKFNQAIKAIFRLSGVEDSKLKGRASWHSFRATFITRLTEAGCPHSIVKELAQHTNGDITQRYIHTSMETKLEWLAKIPPIGDIDLAATYPTEQELPSAPCPEVVSEPQGVARGCAPVW